MEGSSVKAGMASLNKAALRALPGTVSVPRYDRSKITPGIVHIGVGNFHRAHLAWYVHRLMQQGRALDWGIIGAGVRPQDMVMRDKLLRQDCLTTLIELDPDGGRATEVTGAMLDFLPVEDGHKSLIQAMADPAIRIVSLTITEGGYFLDPVTGAFDVTDPDIIHDAAHPEHPRTAFGAIVAALQLRRAAGLGPFTGLCCDNLQENGAILKQAVVGLARLRDPELADWIDSHCSFPNSMVDCIVPATGEGELQLVRTLGVYDAAPVTHEPFRQWVIEDDFCAGRPDWDLIGAEFCKYVHLHEAQKIRVLNGGHQILANVAEIMGIETISQAISHPLIHAMFRKVQEDEIIPQVTPLPGASVRDYLNLIDKRFANQAIVDTVRRVAFDGAARHAGFILPSIRDRLEQGRSVDGLALVEAAWARMCSGIRENGSQIAPNDPNWDHLNKVAQAAQDRPRCWLEMDDIYGPLAQNERFASVFETWLHSLYENGVEETIKIYLNKATRA